MTTDHPETDQQMLKRITLRIAEMRRALRTLDPDLYPGECLALRRRIADHQRGHAYIAARNK